MEIRLAALAALWGERSLQPGGAGLDDMLSERLLEGPAFEGALGFIGVNPALLISMRSRCEHVLKAVEWRSGCSAHFRPHLAGIEYEECDIDRPRAFSDGVLGRLLSTDALAFADHKSGLVSRAYRALGSGGRWVALETVRCSPKTPSEPFASAWSEPQLAEESDLTAAMENAGFLIQSSQCASEAVAMAAREGYQRLSSELEAVVGAGLKGRRGALFLQELAWEAHSWRARVRALEGGALGVRLLVAEKP